MALTNFAALTTEEKTVWSRDLWMAARNASFVMKFAGRGPNAMIQRITELTRTEKGARAVITLIADLEGDGVTGDYTLEDNEEEIKSYDQVIRIDQLRNASRHAGRLADQKSIVNFRGTAKDVLSYWYGDRIDQIGFNTLAGIALTERNDGGPRPVNPTGQNLGDLEFAADVTAPTANRYRNWQTTAGLTTGDTAVSGDTLALPSWEMIVELKALAKTNYVRGIKGPGNSEYYHMFMHPNGLAALKQDTTFIANLQNAGVRGTSNPLFSGGLLTQDGIVIHEHRHVPNTLSSTATKWEDSADVDGQAVLFCGAQALGMADLGLPYWQEEEFDYGNQQGISVGKMLGFLKPVFHSNYNATTADFGVIRVNTAI